MVRWSILRLAEKCALHLRHVIGCCLYKAGGDDHRKEEQKWHGESFRGNNAGFSSQFLAAGSRMQARAKRMTNHRYLSRKAIRDWSISGFRM